MIHIQNLTLLHHGLTLRIIDSHTALGSFHVDDKHNNRNSNSENDNNGHQRQGPCPSQLDNIRNAGRHVRNDTGEDQQR